MICIAIDNGSDHAVGGSYYFAHQAVGKFAEHHIDMVSCVHRAGVSKMYRLGGELNSVIC